MDGSGTIRVLKRDGTSEAFDAAKLALAIWRAVEPFGAEFHQARQLAIAVQFYLCRKGERIITSAALFEIALKSLRCVAMDEAAEWMELQHVWRSGRRTLLRVRHQDGRLTLWDKSWLARQAQGLWRISHATARTIAGRIERHVLKQSAATLTRQALLEMVNEQALQFGLVDAVPVEEYV